jgi:uncharacterized protein
MHHFFQKTKNTVLLALLGLVWAIVGCNGSKKAAETVTYTPDNIVPTDKSLLWRISGKELKQPSYLYGTIHIIPKADLNITEGTWNALKRCKRIAFEIDMKEMTSMRTQFSLLTKAFMKNGTTLKDLLNAEDYAFVQEKMEEKGMSARMFERIKPMFLSMILSNDEEGGGGLGSDKSKSTSVEMELWRTAKMQKIKSAGLETAAYQMSVFDSIPYKDQAKMLMDALREEGGDGDDQLAKMIETYKQQDIEAMQRMIAAETDGVGAFEDLLLDRRNLNWIPIMSQMMAYESVFFAVGAGHLGGSKGVIALLRSAGYTVEAVK